MTTEKKSKGKGILLPLTLALGLSMFSGNADAKDKAWLNANGYQIIEVLGTPSKIKHPKIDGNNFLYNVEGNICGTEKDAKDNINNMAIKKIAEVSGDNSISNPGKKVSNEINKVKKNSEIWYTDNAVFEIPLKNFPENIQKSLKQKYGLEKVADSNYSKEVITESKSSEILKEKKDSQEIPNSTHIPTGLESILKENIEKAVKYGDFTTAEKIIEQLKMTQEAKKGLLDLTDPSVNESFNAISTEINKYENWTKTEQKKLNEVNELSFKILAPGFYNADKQLDKELLAGDLNEVKNKYSQTEKETVKYNELALKTAYVCDDDYAKTLQGMLKSSAERIKTEENGRDAFEQKKESNKTLTGAFYQTNYSNLEERKRLEDKVGEIITEEEAIIVNYDIQSTAIKEYLDNLKTDLQTAKTKRENQEAMLALLKQSILENGRDMREKKLEELSPELYTMFKEANNKFSIKDYRTAKKIYKKIRKNLPEFYWSLIDEKLNEMDGKKAVTKGKTETAVIKSTVPIHIDFDGEANIIAYNSSGKSSYGHENEFNGVEIKANCNISTDKWILPAELCLDKSVKGKMQYGSTTIADLAYTNYSGLMSLLYRHSKSINFGPSVYFNSRNSEADVKEFGIKSTNSENYADFGLEGTLELGKFKVNLKCTKDLMKEGKVSFGKNIYAKANSSKFGNSENTSYEAGINLNNGLTANYKTTEVKANDYSEKQYRTGIGWNVRIPVKKENKK